MRKISTFYFLFITFCLFSQSLMGQTNKTLSVPPKIEVKGTPPTNQPTPTKPLSPFLAVLEERLVSRKWSVEQFCTQNNIVTKRILKEYGSAFVGRGGYHRFCYFSDENQLQTFQMGIGMSTQIINGVRIELQSLAMNALLKAVAEAKAVGLSITPRGTSIAARRSFGETVRLWNSRVYPGLNYWTNKGKITPNYAQQIRSMQLFDQVRAILELEDNGIYFSKDFSKSILNSVAAPGASQHNLMLALDVTQFGNPRVRQILANNGWFQTVASDLPHFTFLGFAEGDLELLGLRRQKVGSQIFWIPNME